MYHTIKFKVEMMVELGPSSQDSTGLLVFHEGTVRQAQIRPYVIEEEGGPVEVADLYFEDGTAAAGVHYEWFSFVD